MTCTTVGFGDVSASGALRLESFMPARVGRITSTRPAAFTVLEMRRGRAARGRRD